MATFERTQRRFTHIFAHNKGAHRTNVDDTELGQLFGDSSRFASIRPAYVHRTKKYHPAHLNDLTIKNKEDAEKSIRESPRHSDCSSMEGTFGETFCLVRAGYRCRYLLRA
jgi:hypothetical protein